MVDAEGHRTEYVYDDAGRLTSTRFHDGSTASVAYDALGRKTTEIDPDGRRTEYGYDALGRLVTVTLAAGTPQATVTSYAYDEQGNRITQTDAEGRATRFEHDVAGRETARLLPGGQRETKAYDLAGQLHSHTDFLGQTTAWSYDSAGRVRTIDYPHDADASFTYTASGQRTSASDGQGTTSWDHDARDRIVRKTDAAGRTIEYSYDAAGNLVSRVTANQSLVYTYDALNRMTSVTATVGNEAPRTTTYEYDRVGNRTAMVGADGVRTEYGYDTRNRLRTLAKRTAAGALLFAATYTVDATGLRTAVEEADAAGISRTVAYQYDPLKRLTEESIADRDPARSRTSTWTYDRVGNRQAQTVEQGPVGAAEAATTTYTYDVNDRLLAETVTEGLGGTPSTTSYTYDANGNTILKTTPAGVIEYAYDDANRLKELRRDGTRTTYAYDTDGLRQAQTTFPATGEPTTTRYLVDGSYAYAQVVEEYTQAGAAIPQLQAVLTFGDDLIAQTRYDQAGTPTHRTVHADGFGSTRFLTDAAATITDTWSYDAFGNEIARTGTTPTEHLYRGEQFDPNLGFYYLRARYYDPSSGRFTGMDTFGGFTMDPMSLHKYTYANSDPVLYSDPSGHFGVIQVFGVNINVGGAIAFLGTRAGLVAVAKFSAEVAFEYATGIPVLTSPRSLLRAVRSLRGIVGDLADGAIKRLRAGSNFEKLVSEMWGLTKNTTCFKNGRPSSPPGCFIPDFLVTKAGRIVEVKTSMGAVKEQQFKEFIRIAQASGQKMSMVFLKKPSSGDVEQLKRWALDVTGGSDDDFLLSIIHVLD
jgi:RHS repeat-associated protein